MVKNKKIPMRSCVVTREKCEKKDLIRVVRTTEGRVIVDLTGKANGRGAYLKKDLAVIEKCEKNKIIERVLEVPIESEIFEQLKDIVK